MGVEERQMKRSKKGGRLESRSEGDERIREEIMRERDEEVRAEEGMKR